VFLGHSTGWGSVFFKLMPLCSVRTFLCHLSCGFEVSPWGHVAVIFLHVFKVLLLPNNQVWRDAFFASGVGWATMVVMVLLCIGRFPFHYGGLYPQTVELRQW
jgi:hypothetical protein